MTVEQIETYSRAAAAVLAVLLALLASGHAVLYKRDPRAAVSWAGLIWFAPILGSLLYVLFGINRIQRRASKLKRRRKPREILDPAMICTPEELKQALGAGSDHLADIARVGEALSGQKMLEGNKVDALVNGEQAYPAMLEEIDRAKKSVGLCMYIFGDDPLGQKFIDALTRAQERGVAVRVLIDSVGSPSSVYHALRSRGVAAERFLPLLVPWRTRFMNLRNHRKILTVDGVVGFTGGMNLRQSHLVETPQPHHEQDVQFRLEGPVVEHLVDAFVDDWAFATDEILKGPEWFPRPPAAGKVGARGLPLDPAETRDVLRWVIVAALGAARSSVRIVTPYFLPDPAIIAALNIAALRGVEVDILLPQKNDNLVVQWATTAMLWQVLIAGCRVWLTPPPFDHSKLLVVDDAWLLLGSANLDTRSLRLNFEFNVECYDRALAAGVSRQVKKKLEGARPVTLKEVDSRGLGIKLRDGMARLFTPYL